MKGVRCTFDKVQQAQLSSESPPCSAAVAAAVGWSAAGWRLLLPSASAETPRWPEAVLLRLSCCASMGSASCCMASVAASASEALAAAFFLARLRACLLRFAASASSSSWEHEEPGAPTCTAAAP